MRKLLALAYLFTLSALAFGQSITTSPLQPASGTDGITGLPTNFSILIGVPVSQQLCFVGGVVTSGGVTACPVGAQGQYHHSINSGSLPPGLTVSSTGLLSGTDTTAPSCPYTATDLVQDSGNSAQTVTLQFCPLAVQSVNTPICPPGSVLASGTVTCHTTGNFGTSSQNIITQASLDSLATFSCTGTCGSFAANVFTAGGSAGTANLTATFNSVASSSLAVTVTTAGSPVVIQYPTSTLPNGQINQPYPDTPVSGQLGIGQCIQIQASGGTPPYTYSISVNPSNLPSGLTLGSSTGQICGSPTTAAGGASFTIQVADSASHSSTVPIGSGITVASLSSLVVNLANNPISANASTQASAIGTYSDSTSAPLPNALSGSVVATSSGTGSAASTIQVSTGTATTTGWAAIGFAGSWISGACSGTTMTITSANETFTSIATQIGQTGTPPPYVNCMQAFLATNVTGAAADKPTCNFSTASGIVCAIVYVSGIPTSSLLDQSPANTSSTAGTATACTPNSITTGQANTIIFGVCFPNGATGFTPPSNFASAIAATSPSSYDIFYQVANAVQTGAFAASFSGGASNEDAALFSIKANAVPAGSVLWFSGTTANATITSAGTITGQPITTTGTSVITGCVGGTGGATCTGGISGTATITVQVTNPDNGLILAPNPTASATLLTGGGFSCGFSSPAPNNTPCQFTCVGNVTNQIYACTFGSSNQAVASINTSSGVITPLTVGSTTISATGSGLAPSCTNPNSICTSTLNVVSQGSGTVLNATDCSSTALLNAWNQMTSGAYIINLPSCAAGGSGTYASQFSKSIPSGVTSVTIHGNSTISCSGTPGTATYACTATDNTILVDSFSSSSNPIWSIGVGNAAFRLTGVTFQGGTGSQQKSDGFIDFSGTSTSWRVDHCHFNAQTYSPLNAGNGGLTTYGVINGVVDHSIFDLYGEGNGVRLFQWGDQWGDLGFSQPTQLGSSNFIFMENDIFNGVANDCNSGGRFVMRYSTVNNPANFNDSGLVQGHQMGQGGTAGRERGCRVQDVNHNYFFNVNPSGNAEYTNNYTGGSGVALTWANSVSSGYNYDIVYQIDREAATGHTQSAPPNGGGYCGSNSSGITSAWDGNSIAATGYPCISQTGRGQGQLLNGQLWPNALNTVTGTIAWPQQMLEPDYLWNETCPSCTAIYNAASWNGVAPVANRDFYAQVSASAQTSATSPFNGTSGTGFGTLAFRPTTCTAGAGGTYGISPTGSYGVGYFATDANSGQGVLYVCTATNTWTAIYSPYVYPHPLDH